MKAKYLIYILATFLFFLGSCREISVSTVVNEDGSFTRVITITNKEKLPSEDNLPYPVDESWERQENRDTTDGKAFSVTFTKRYDNSEILNKELEMDTSWLRDVNREIDVKKRFWFFNSYLTYKETWKAANPFTQLDYKEYLSAEDLLWINGFKLAIDESDSTAMEDAEAKVEEFLKESLALEISTELMKGVEALNLNSFKPEDVSMYHDSIVVRLDNWDFDSSAEFIDFLADWTGNEDIIALHDNKNLRFDEMDKEIAFLEKVLMMESFHAYVEMPGIITETNSPSFRGNQVSWKVSGMSFFLEDYEMLVESRIVNTWAYVAAGILLLLLIVVLIVKARR